jgi:uncharacterized protein (UPF0254 family)
MRHNRIDRPDPDKILEYIKGLSESSLEELSLMLARDKDLKKIFSYVPKGTQIIWDPDEDPVRYLID